MTRVRMASFRRGDLAEGLAIEMIRSFCAVAPVPRPEDVGIDLVSTILRYEGSQWHAGDTFYLQVKSGRRRSPILLERNDFIWFKDLKLPFFYAWMNLDSNVLEVFGTHRVRWHANYPDFKRIRIRFVPRTPRTKTPNASWEIWLGEPILRFHVDDLRDGFDRVASDIMSAWLEIIFSNGNDSF